MNTKNFNDVLDINTIIDEMVDKRSKMKGTGGVFAPTQKKLFNECWKALNSWILLRMSKKQGVIIPALGKFAWEFTEPNLFFEDYERKEGKGNEVEKMETGRNQRQQNIKCRPVFLPSKQFCKAAKMKYVPWGPDNLYSNCEEANLSKISIKHSKK